MCGEKHPQFGTLCFTMGSPPRVRGKELDFLPGFFGDRITPACAGKSAKAVTIEAIQKDHPRVCGEKPRFCGQADLVRGSPPRVRGKGWRTVAEALMIGITPACAGKSRLQGSNLQLPGDHPRVCGEKNPSSRTVQDVEGSPPRVRGKGLHVRQYLCCVGITPACAGKSGLQGGAAPRLRDHPRVCGEKASGGCGYSCPAGSPPRVRGKDADHHRCVDVPGITPACAGKSVHLPQALWCPQDHPRVCGEKFLGFGASVFAQGSPPRVRGKVLRLRRPQDGQRITPACAGKRRLERNAAVNQEDHPRVCGEKL